MKLYESRKVHNDPHWRYWRLGPVRVNRTRWGNPDNSTRKQNTYTVKFWKLRLIWNSAFDSYVG